MTNKKDAYNFDDIKKCELLAFHLVLNIHQRGFDRKTARNKVEGYLTSALYAVYGHEEKD